MMNRRIQTTERTTFKHLALAILAILIINFGMPVGDSSVRSSSVTLAQSSITSLSGIVIDDAGAIVPGAGVVLLNISTGFQRETKVNAEGIFAFPFVPPGIYKVAITQDGFATVIIENLTLNINDPRSIRIRLKVGGINDTVVIKADAVFRDSPTVSTVIDRQFVENLPANGQNVMPFIALTPGVVPIAASSAASGLAYSVNGQRATANYLTIDGISANIAAGNGPSPGPAVIGALPGLNLFGGINNLVSIEALQELKISTSAGSPEFGRTTGGQISIVTRSGTNEFHGSVFNYFRNEALDANDWFANRSGLRKPPLRQNDFGGVLGGPLLLPRFDDGALRLDNKRRLFFFFSYEGMRVRQPQVAMTQVPSNSLRQQAAPQVRPFLDAFPIGRGLENPITGMVPFFASYSNPAVLNAASIRIDQTVNNRLMIFGRYNDAPSENLTRRTETPSNLDRTILNTRTLTFGATLSIRPEVANDLRFNYSRTRYNDSSSLDSFAGAIPLADSQIFPAFASRNNSQVDFKVSLRGPLAEFKVGRNVEYLQRQINLVDTLSMRTGKHQLKFGIDYRRLLPRYRPSVYTQDISFENATALETGRVSYVILGAGDEAKPLLTNVSTFWQDTWRASRRLTMTYGMRWEVNPSPSTDGGVLPLTVIGFDNPANLKLAPKNSRLWKTTYRNFAPRFGAAYQISQTRNRETVLRGGFGIFYDLGSGYALSGYNGFPFLRGWLLMDQLFPLEASMALPPPPTNVLGLPDFLSIVNPHLQLPYTLQWNLAVEQSLGPNQTVSATYAAARGRRLLSSKRFNPLREDYLFMINAITNDARSDYHALQVQFQRRLSRGLQALANYSWSHSTDLASDENQYFGGLYKGASDFDVRHLFSGAITYDLPALSGNKVAGLLFRGWSVDSIIRAQSALPVNVVANTRVNQLSPARGNLYENLRPNLILGVPLYLKDSTAPGGKRLNPAAFSSPEPIDILTPQGTLGRNALRGFPFSQLDVSLRRKFALTEKISLQFKTDVFNIFNHPNFSNPEAPLYSGFNVEYVDNLRRIATPIPNPSFGLSQSMVGRRREGTAGLGGLNSLSQEGGPRSIQFSLKLQF